MDKPLISIIIPVYNALLYIEKCLESCISQTYKNIEIIVVNDGSTDSSKSIIEKYLKKDARILLVNQPNLGVNVARERAFGLAKGNYVFFLDSDDYISTNTIEILYGKLIENEVDFVECSYNIIDNNKLKIVNSKEGVDFSVDYWNCFFYRFSIWGILLKKTLLENVYFENIPMGEDALLKANIVSNSEKFMLVNIPLYYYVKHRGSLSNLEKIQSVENGILFVSAIQKFFCIHENMNSELKFVLQYTLMQRIGSYYKYLGFNVKHPFLINVLYENLLVNKRMINFLIWHDKLLLLKNIILYVYLRLFANE
ncbi:glycosyltransferase family 2 protein [uncultured Parabacteroides sp.]|uniref:glycosyltransferase family 2 protein n=1 Tax=uncultured Parabacteroides sp. TaxID=512312 RepID=UPI0025FC4AD0|nr:glycosyltransferase family 2 protein [uncultured Parabacteroides sp.]